MRELYFVRHGESLWKSHVKVPIKNMTKGRQQKADAPELYPYVPLDQGGQLDGQLIQIGDIQVGITVDAFDAWLVIADGGCCEENLFASVLLLDAAEIFFGCGTVVPSVCGLTVGYQNQEL